MAARPMSRMAKRFNNVWTTEPAIDSSGTSKDIGEELYDHLRACHPGLPGADRRCAQPAVADVRHRRQTHWRAAAGAGEPSGAHSPVLRKERPAAADVHLRQ